MQRPLPSKDDPADATQALAPASGYLLISSHETSAKKPHISSTASLQMPMTCPGPKCGGGAPKRAQTGMPSHRLLRRLRYASLTQFFLAAPCEAKVESKVARPFEAQHATKRPKMRGEASRGTMPGKAPWPTDLVLHWPLRAVVGRALCLTQSLPNPVSPCS